ncbi:hypothetical protein [Janibacter sp. G56]|uniref:hypothetical protein n=1 Tax=Janibacter sp. G56 TaxID=3418717 RepID=UPI003D03A126
MAPADGEQVGSVAQEAARFLAALGQHAEASSSRAPRRDDSRDESRAEHDDHADHDAHADHAEHEEREEREEHPDRVCGWCPLCSAARGLQAVAPESLDRLGAAIVALGDALRDVATSALRPDADAGSAAPSGSADRGGSSRVVPVVDDDADDDLPDDDADDHTELDGQER